jgi:phage terminase small subunit
METTELNRRRQLFVREFLVDQNATRAAIAAGYSDAAPAAQGCRLLADPVIKGIIEDEMTARLDRLSITADWVLNQLKIEALDRSEGSTHSARVAALTTLTKCLGLAKAEPVSESKVNFIINLGEKQRPPIDHVA